MSVHPFQPQPRVITRTSSSRLLAVLMLALLPRVLRAAASPVSTPRRGPGLGNEAAARSVCAPKNATPGAGTPGAAMPRNPVEKRDMHSLSHAVDVGASSAPAEALDHVGEARRTALLRWHGHRAYCALLVDLGTHDHFPLIACSDPARAFAPDRRAPAPGGHCA